MSNIATKVLSAQLNMTCLGQTVLDRQATEEIRQAKNAGTGAYRAQKARLKSALEPFVALRGKARSYFRSVTLPGVADGLRILPSAALGKITEQINKYREEDAVLLTTLRANYTQEIEKDRQLLGAGFDSSLYPSSESLGQYFDIRLVVTDLPMGDYERLSSLDGETKARLKKEHDALLTQVAVQARTEVMTKLTELIERVANDLSDPNRERFFDSTFDGLREYLDIIPTINVTDDPAINAMAKAAREKLDFQMSEVKKSALLKETAANRAKAILGDFSEFTAGRKLVA